MMKSFSQVLFKQTMRSYQPLFFFSKKQIKLPSMGDSISQGGVKNFEKKIGDYVALDEIIAYVETDKITVDIRSPEAGILTQLFAKEGDNVEVGAPFFEIDTSAPKPAATVAETKKSVETKVTVQENVKQTTKETAPKEAAPKPSAAVTAKVVVKQVPGSRNTKREPMSRMRTRIAQRLKDSQNTYALLTTFNECDMSGVMLAREQLQADFQKKHGIKLGFMSFFVKATVQCLQEIPIINAVIEGNEIIYRDYVDVSVAVATPNGLMVPVLRNCENQSFADIERNLAALGQKGKDGKITPDDMAGGTFTISNGGVFGSMMGTPIINPPQSAILGMHAIINRPVVRDDLVVARPMMYLALTYDHRIMDGREAAIFLKKLSTLIEDPRRLLLDI